MRARLARASYRRTGRSTASRRLGRRAGSAVQPARSWRGRPQRRAWTQRADTCCMRAHTNPGLLHTFPSAHLASASPSSVQQQSVELLKMAPTKESLDMARRHLLHVRHLPVWHLGKLPAPGYVMSCASGTACRCVLPTRHPLPGACMQGATPAQWYHACLYDQQCRAVQCPAGHSVHTAACTCALLHCRLLTDKNRSLRRRCSCCRCPRR